MLKKLLFVAIALGVAITPPLNCVAQAPRQIIQDFSRDPVFDAWEKFGDPALIRWNSADENLSVTWDSSLPNSYLRLPLGTVMTRHDDFEVSLDLLLNDFAAGVDSSKRGTFQLAFGFQNYADASSPTFLRAAPNASPNLVEFNFMPDTGFGPTIWPAVMSTNGAMNYSGASDFNIFNLPVGEDMRVTLAYSSTNETATIIITTNGVLVGPVTSARLATNDVAFGRKFTQFKVDTFAIASYSDAGQGSFAGSLLAHGVIDNIVITVPPPPILKLSGQFANEAWETTFLSRTNWSYQLQVSADLRSWMNVGGVAAGDGAVLTMTDTALPRPAIAFHRVAAQPID